MKILNRRWALALITASMFGTAGATVAAATADAAPIGYERPPDRPTSEIARR